MDVQYFDLNTAANIIGISPITLRRAIKAHKITFKAIGDNYNKKYMLSYEDLDNYIKYAFENNIFDVDIIKDMKDRLEKHKQLNQKNNESKNIPQIGINKTIEENKVETQNLINFDNIKNDLIELFKEQENYANQKIKQYEEKLENTNKELEYFKNLNKEYEYQIQTKINQIENLKNIEKILNKEISFLKALTINNLKIIKELCLRINQQIIQIKEENKVTKIYMDIIC